MSYSYAPKTEKNSDYQKYTGVGGSSSRQKLLSFRLGNVFQMKVRSGEEEKKVDLFNLDFSTSYNFEKENQRWGEIGSNLHSRAVPLLDLTLSSRHNLYDEDTGKLRVFSPRLVNISMSTSFSRSFSFGGDIDSEPGASSNDQLNKSKTFIDDSDDTGIGGSRRTSLAISLEHSYSESRSGGRTVSKTNNVNSGMKLILTPAWKFEFDFSYDIENKETITPALRITRDLNCWAGEFEWRPSGYLAGYYFRIYLKKIDAIKIEQTVGRLGRTFSGF
jgi:hypothetical protein